MANENSLEKLTEELSNTNAFIYIPELVHKALEYDKTHMRNPDWLLRQLFLMVNSCNRFYSEEKESVTFGV